MSAIADSAELGRRIRRLRTQRHLTLKQLEQRSGLSATHLSEVERGRTSPTIGALVRIARALGRDAAYFIEPEEMPDTARLGAGPPAAFETPTGARIEPLTRGVPGSQLFAYRLSLGSGRRGPLRLPAQDTPGDALYFVRRGRALVTVGELRLSLGRGDGVQASLGRPHHLEAADGEVSEVLLVLTRPLEGEA